MTKSIGAAGPKNVHVYDRWYDPTHCPYCGANYEDVTMWPHICKETTYQSMPILRFEKFDAGQENS